MCGGSSSKLNSISSSDCCGSINCGCLICIVAVVAVNSNQRNRRANRPNWGSGDELSVLISALLIICLFAFLT